MDIKTRIRVALGIEDEPVALAFEGKLKDGTIIVSEADALGEGVEVMVMTEDGTTIPVPVGTYELEDGKKFEVKEEGIIASMEEAEEEEEVEAGDDDEDYKDDDKEEMSVENKLSEFSEVVMTIFQELREEIDTLKSEIEEVTNQSLAKDENIEELQSENLELSKKLKEEPATENINIRKFSEQKAVKLTKQEYNRLTAQERFLYNLNK
jgi:chromosome segregation ATPase